LLLSVLTWSILGGQGCQYCGRSGSNEVLQNVGIHPVSSCQWCKEAASSSQFRSDVNSCKKEWKGKRAQLLLRWLRKVHNANSEKWSVFGKIRGQACVRGHESYSAKTRIFRLHFCSR